MSFRLLLVALILLVAPSAAYGQDPAPQECEGPPELCQQLLELNTKLAAAKAAKKAVETKIDQKVDQEVAVEVAKDDKSKEERMAKVIAFAAALAVGLKILLSILDQWKGYFTTVRGKAVLKLITLAVGFVAFLATNIGMGMSWWQSLILAGGGPGALLVHDIAEILPALTGKKQKKSAAQAAALASERPPAA